MQLQVEPIKVPGSLRRPGPSRLTRVEIEKVLDDVLVGAESRRLQYGAKELPLYGKVQANSVKLDVIASLYNGQLVALSTTFVEELLLALRG
jgi:hypothetical protein